MEIDIVSRVGTSLWDGLSRHLVGSFTTMQQENGKWVTMPSEGVVKAAITEAQLDVSLNWQSPFESAGPESRAPMLMALLQSGQIQPLIDVYKRQVHLFRQKRAPLVARGLLPNEPVKLSHSELLARLKAVSYTHLDVYKRQASRACKLALDLRHITRPPS